MPDFVKGEKVIKLKCHLINTDAIVKCHVKDKVRLHHTLVHVNQKSEFLIIFDNFSVNNINNSKRHFYDYKKEETIKQQLRLDYLNENEL